MAHSPIRNLAKRRSSSNKVFSTTSDEIFASNHHHPKREKNISEENTIFSHKKNIENSKKVDKDKIKNASITKVVLKLELNKVQKKTQLLLTERKGKNDDIDFFAGIISEDHLDKCEISEENIFIETERLHKEYMKQTFIALKSIRKFKKIPKAKVLEKMLNLPRSIENEGKKTVIFDMDETLIHCSGSNKGHVSISLNFPNGKTLVAGLNIRPYAIECLEAANNFFEVIVFTASNKHYADVVLDYLDPEHKLIHHRLYRDSCFQVNNMNVKDLRIINRRMQDMVIIDNSVFSFAFNLDNAVPILTWIKNPFDKELLNLIPYFNVIADAYDVREINRALFHLDTFYEDYYEEYSNI
ncbi:hypothetical protein SteCoe_14994 [Stentor coeruleus]|uniref:FCP1 homology domain-containing protein n=1 Tax=Stentor coeruleus TaxID=5963 RepID=A0A1R2C4Q2_9CILI|nr:hypothetical protein SteCoe_14994 [Stentor coeruleus]